LPTLVADGRRLADGPGDEVEMHLGMDDAAVPGRHVAPAFLDHRSALHRLHRVEQAGVGLGPLGHDQTDVLGERVKSGPDPRRGSDVASPLHRRNHLAGHGARVTDPTVMQREAGDRAGQVASCPSSRFVTALPSDAGRGRG
jgi:hypothetical protein